MIQKISHRLTRKPKLVVIIAVLLLIPCLIGIAATRINYDILTYLPPDLDSTKGEGLLEEPFHDAATSMLIVDDMPARYTEELVESIQKVKGVSNAVWISDLLGIQIPMNMLPEELRETFFSGGSTMIVVQYDMPGASDETMSAITQIRALCNEHCFLAGFSVLIKDTKDLVDQELPFYILIAVALSFAAMALTLDSWLLPVAFLSGIGLAVMYNFGTNFFMGEISYITKAIAAVLQLGVTMDYSIFLYRRYEEERGRYDDKRDAMAKAIEAAFTSLSGSSLTTIAGFLALCFMQLLLGRDIGIVMAKGVIIGVLTVIIVLPSLLLTMDKGIERCRHRSLIPSFDRINRFIIGNRKKFAVIFLLLFVPAVYAQNHASVYYKLDEALPQDMPSIIATNILKDEYDMASTHFVILDDDLSSAGMNELTARIKSVPGVESLVSYNELLSADIPDFFIPQEIKDMLKQDGKQLIMINSRYTAASDEVAVQLDEIRNIVKSYDSGAYITGEAALTADLISTASVDFKVTSYISIAAIFLIIAIVFRSLTVPVILVSTIELAIFINQGIPYFTGTVIPFITPTIIGCVQLGATVDYAILMTTRFREEIRNGKDRKEAIRIAASASDGAIITSSLVLFCATLGVGLISKVEIISNICLMLSRGALISAVVSIFIMPSVLMICEPVIARTSLNWRHLPRRRGEKAECLSNVK
ncbi:MAG: RND family transporter [Oscillospiraceae bacterium]